MYKSHLKKLMKKITVRIQPYVDEYNEHISYGDKRKITEMFISYKMRLFINFDDAYSFLIFEENDVLWLSWHQHDHYEDDGKTHVNKFGGCKAFRVNDNEELITTLISFLKSGFNPKRSGWIHYNER